MEMRSRVPIRLLPVCVIVHLWLFPLSVAGQEPELVANLATGRVVLCVAKDGIVIAATEKRAEAESRPPAVVQLNQGRVAILLGAVDWIVPASNQEAVHLDAELLRVIGTAQQARDPNDPNKAADIEAISFQLLEPLRTLTSRIHTKVDLRPDEPLLEVILTGYVRDYGPEVWRVRYFISQNPLRADAAGHADLERRARGAERREGHVDSRRSASRQPARA